MFIIVLGSNYTIYQKGRLRGITDTVNELEEQGLLVFDDE